MAHVAFLQCMCCVESRPQLTCWSHGLLRVERQHPFHPGIGLKYGCVLME
jgi:hypothetical protein